jgi:hypothetical protein
MLTSSKYGRHWPTLHIDATAEVQHNAERRAVFVILKHSGEDGREYKFKMQLDPLEAETLAARLVENAAEARSRTLDNG